MKYCTEFVLFWRNSFEFVRILLENQVKNIQHTGGSDRARLHQVLVEQLDVYSKELRNLERATLIADAQRVSENLHANQERERKEIGERIAEEARCLDDFKACYQNFINDLQRSRIVTKNAESVIASARAAIAKTQVLIRDDELKLTNERKRVEELEAAKGQVQQELNIHTLKFEALQA